MIRRVNVSVLVSISLLGLLGCGVGSAIDSIIAQLDEMILSVDRLTANAHILSREWQQKVDDTVKTLRHDASGLIANEVRFVADHAIDSASTALKGDIDFVEAKVVGYLVAIADGLREERERLVKADDDKALEETITRIVRRVVLKARASMPPNAESCNPDLAYLDYANKFGEDARFAADKYDGIITFIGWGFAQRNLSIAEEQEGEARYTPPEFYVCAIGPKVTPRTISEAGNVVPISPYEVKINLRYGKLLSEIRPDDAGMALMCKYGGKDYVIGKIPIVFGQKPEQPTVVDEPAPTIYALNVTELHCRETDDWFSDHVYAKVFVDGNFHSKTRTVRIDDGETKKLKFSSKFKNRVELNFYDKEDIVSDQSIGTVLVEPANVDRKSFKFGNGSADYTLYWD
jgi:hypothetical protein